MTDLERIAKAIEDAGEAWVIKNGFVTLADVPPLVYARAAIEAMREPSEAVINAGRLVPGSPGFCDEPGEPPDAEEVFEAMVEAILK